MRSNLKLIGGRTIKSPKAENTRPTSLIVREAIFNILSTTVLDSIWLDLFSGSGSIACEAYNHGAKKILAVEKNKTNAFICKSNLLSLEGALKRKKDIEIICWDVFSWIEKSKKMKRILTNIDLEKNKFDFIYLDPPYSNNYYYKVLEEIFNSNLISERTIVIYEHSKRNCVEKNKLWKIIDIRSYGQSTITFLVKI